MELKKKSVFLSTCKKSTREQSKKGSKNFLKRSLNLNIDFYLYFLYLIFYFKIIIFKFKVTFNFYKYFNLRF